MDKPYWNVFRTPDENNKEWKKVGVAFVNRDGSFNLRLNGTLTPADKLQMRPGIMKDKPKDASKEQGMGADIA